MLTNARLALLDAAVGKMTPGPWFADESNVGTWLSQGTSYENRGDFITDSDLKPSDAHGIALLRNEYAALRERLRLAEEMMKEAVGWDMPTVGDWRCSECNRVSTIMARHLRSVESTDGKA